MARQTLCWRIICSPRQFYSQSWSKEVFSGHLAAQVSYEATLFNGGLLLITPTKNQSSSLGQGVLYRLYC